MEANDAKNSAGNRNQRVLFLTVMIVLITFLWVVLLLSTNLPMLALAGIGLLSVLVLSLATAWTAMAFPGRGGH